MDKTRQFITLECYHPYYLIDNSQYLPTYESVRKHTFFTKIRLDMIARIDGPESFDAVPSHCNRQYYNPDKEEHKTFVYQRVVVLCSTSKGINGFQDSLYITERCINSLQKALDEAFGILPNPLLQEPLENR